MQNADKTTLLASVLRSWTKRSGLIAVITLVAASLLAGCGFHLRGNVTLPDSISTIELRGPSGLVDAMTVLFNSQDITVTTRHPDAILIMRDDIEKQTLSVDSTTGKEREHTLAYTVVYRLLSVNGQELVPDKTVNIVRDYVFDEDAVFGTNREREVLHYEMRQEAAIQILNRLSAWHR